MSDPSHIEECLSGQRERFAVGETVLVEDYLKKVPSISDNEDDVLDLIYQEMMLRKDKGESPSVQEYLDRFPELGEQLRVQFALEALFLESTTDSVPDQTPAEHQPVVLSPEETQIPGYELIQALGQGGMGVVFKARQKELNRLVALKMIRRGAHAHDQEIARFHIEAQALARLQHPHIVQIFEVGEHQGQSYIALELIEGDNLARKLEGSPWDCSLAAQITETLAQAIGAAHQQGIVHRDLKPANILLSQGSRPQVKITDFGLAKMLEADQKQTETGAFLGTPSYAAPEQARGQIREIGPQTDVYALGAILYELLTGRPPFCGTTIMETLTQISQKEPVSPRLLNPTVPTDLETICLKCLRKSPKERYANGQELSEDLRRYLTGEPIHARPVGALERGWKWTRRHPALASLLVVSLLSLCSLVAFGVSLSYQSDLKAAKERGDRLLYDSNMMQAHQAWHDGRAPYMLELLERQHPKVVGKDYRSFEWHFLWALGHSESKQLKLASDFRISPDGKTFACYLRSGKVVICDLATGKELRSFNYKIDVNLLSWLSSFSPQGDRLAFVDNDNRVHILDAQTGKLIRLFDKHKAPISMIVLRKDWKLVASLTFDKLIIRELETGKLVQTIDAKRLKQFTLRFHPDGKHILGAGPQGGVYQFSIQTGKLVRAFRTSLSPVSSVVFSSDRRLIATPSWKSSSIPLVDAATGRKIRDLTGHKRPISDVAFSEDGLYLASASMDGTAILWDLKTGKNLQQFKGHKRGRLTGVSRVAFHPDGRHLITAGNDRTIRYWPLHQSQASRKITLSAFEQVTSLAFSPDGKTLASSTWQGRVRLHGKKTLELPQKPRFGRNPLTFSPDGRFLIVGRGEADSKMRVWDVAKKKVAKTIPRQHQFGINDLAYSPRGNVLAWTEAGKKVVIHDADSLAQVRILKQDRNPARIAFRPKSDVLVVGGTDYSLVFWNWKTGEKIREQNIGMVPCSLTFSPDGKWLAVGELFQDVLLFDAASGVQEPKIQGHNAKVVAVAFTPDGKRLISADEDGIVKLWDIVSRQEVLTLRIEKAIHSLAVSRDGNQIAIGILGGVHIYDARNFNGN